jgi:hypothetical protein
LRLNSFTNPPSRSAQTFAQGREIGKPRPEHTFGYLFGQAAAELELGQDASAYGRLAIFLRDVVQGRSYTRLIVCPNGDSEIVDNAGRCASRPQAIRQHGIGAASERP